MQSSLSESGWLESHLQLHNQVLQPVTLQRAALAWLDRYALVTRIGKDTPISARQSTLLEHPTGHVDAVKLPMQGQTYLYYDAICNIPVHILRAGPQHGSQSPKG